MGTSGAERDLSDDPVEGGSEPRGSEAALVEPDAPPAPMESRRRRLIAFVVLVVFVAIGIFYFGPRMPREMQIRFELPPTLRGDGVELARGSATRMSAVMFDADGARVGTLDLALDGGPRTPPAVVNLRPGTYAFAVSVSGAKTGPIPMHGVAELSGGDGFVSLKAGARR